MEERFIKPERQEINKGCRLLSNSRLKNFKRWLKSMKSYGYTNLKKVDFSWTLDGEEEVPKAIANDIEWTSGICNEGAVVSINNLIKMIR